MNKKTFLIITLPLLAITLSGCGLISKKAADNVSQKIISESEKKSIALDNILENNNIEIESNENTSDAPINIIEVTAKQWEFIPNPIRVKFGDYVRLKVKSVDVAHSFTLPDFNIDRRLEPGKEEIINFVANKKGRFPFRCAVFCGSGHSRMAGELIVE